MIDPVEVRRRQATHRHTKTQGLYILLHRGVWEADVSHVCIYQAVTDGVVWVRPSVEFDDGRFEQLLPGGDHKL